MSTYKISKETIASYKIIDGPKTDYLEVVGEPQIWVNPKLAQGSRGATYKHSVFINFKAIDARNVERCIETLQAHGGEEMPITEFKFGLTKEEIIHHDSKEKELPMAGETIKVAIAFATNKDGSAVLDKAGKRILEVTNFKVQTTSASTKSMADMLGTATTAKTVAAPTTSEEDTAF